MIVSLLVLSYFCGLVHGSDRSNFSNHSPQTYSEYQSLYSIGLATDDDDFDGLPNLYEYFAQLDPTAGDTMSPVLWIEHEADSAATLHFLSPKFGNSDLWVEVQKSTTLMESWTTIATRDGNNPWTSDTTLVSTPYNDSLELIEISEPVDNRCFYRLSLHTKPIQPNVVLAADFGVSTEIGSNEEMIQAIVDNLGLKNQGGIIQLPPGILRMKEGILVQYPNIILQGDKQSPTILSVQRRTQTNRLQSGDSTAAATARRYCVLFQSQLASRIPVDTRIHYLQDTNSIGEDGVIQLDGKNYLYVEDASGFQVGDEVIIRFRPTPSDKNETYLTHFARIKQVIDGPEPSVFFEPAIPDVGVKLYEYAFTFGRVDGGNPGGNFDRGQIKITGTDDDGYPPHLGDTVYQYTMDDNGQKIVKASGTVALIAEGATGGLGLINVDGEFVLGGEVYWDNDSTYSTIGRVDASTIAKVLSMPSGSGCEDLIFTAHDVNVMSQNLSFAWRASEVRDVYLRNCEIRDFCHYAPGAIIAYSKRVLVDDLRCNDHAYPLHASPSPSPRQGLIIYGGTSDIHITSLTSTGINRELLQLEAEARGVRVDELYYKHNPEVFDPGTVHSGRVFTVSGGSELNAGNIEIDLSSVGNALNYENRKECLRLSNGTLMADNIAITGRSPEFFIGQIGNTDNVHSLSLNGVILGPVEELKISIPLLNSGSNIEYHPLPAGLYTDMCYKYSANPVAKNSPTDPRLFFTAPSLSLNRPALELSLADGELVRYIDIINRITAGYRNTSHEFYLPDKDRFLKINRNLAVWSQDAELILKIRYHPVIE